MEEKIIILDYSTGKTYIAEYDNNIFENIQDFFDTLNDYHNLNLKESQCSWMIVKDKLELIHL